MDVDRRIHVEPPTQQVLEPVRDTLRFEFLDHMANGRRGMNNHAKRGDYWNGSANHLGKTLRRQEAVRGHERERLVPAAEHIRGVCGRRVVTRRLGNPRQECGLICIRRCQTAERPAEVVLRGGGNPCWPLPMYMLA